jgi:hypothetical protein
VDGDSDLAVGLLAQLPAVLMLHADGMLALFGEAGVIEDEDPLGAGQGWVHHRAVAAQDLLFVPGALVDELLQGLLGVLDVRQVQGQGDACGHRFDALALPVFEQSAEVDAAPGELRGVAIEVAKVSGVVVKPVEDFGGEFGREGLAHTDHTNKAPGGFVGG